MNLKQKITNDLTAAMRTSDDVRRGALRQLLAAIREAELDKRSASARKKGPAGELTDADIAALEQTELDDDETMAVVQKDVKATREAIADARKAGRADLVAANEASLSVAEAYLPKQLSREEVAALAEAAIREAGATGINHIGAVMKLVSPKTKGLADGRVVNEVVRELLARGAGSTTG